RVQRRRRGLLRTYLTPKQAIPHPARLILGIGSFVVIITLWSVGSVIINNPLFLPSLPRVGKTWIDMVQHQHFLDDVAWSTFRLVLMVMDIAHRVPDEMLNVAYTLGASRWKVFYKVFLPATFPEVVDALRITIGWAWTYLIVAELLGAERGIGTFILISERFL